MTFRLPAEKPRAPNSCIATSVMRARLSSGRFHHVAVAMPATLVTGRSLLAERLAEDLGLLRLVLGVGEDALVP